MLFCLKLRLQRHKFCESPSHLLTTPNNFFHEMGIKIPVIRWRDSDRLLMFFSSINKTHNTIAWKICNSFLWFPSQFQYVALVSMSGIGLDDSPITSEAIDENIYNKKRRKQVVAEYHHIIQGQEKNDKFAIYSDFVHWIRIKFRRKMRREWACWASEEFNRQEEWKSLGVFQFLKKFWMRKIFLSNTIQKE